ncbi:MAG TPA: CvpA family protein [Myxococcota bacterium]|nr:CvpA family protein [Myxococcota bacterium]
MAFDLAALCLLVVFIALGVWRGAFAGSLRVATVAAAYVAGWLAATRLAKLVALLSGGTRLTAAVCLGSGAFLFVYLAGTVTSALLIRMERERRADQPRGAFDRFGGACFGALQACLSLLLLAVLGSVLDAAYRAGLPQGMDAGHSFLVASTRQVVAEGLGGVLGDGPGARLAVKLVANPGDALVSLRGLLGSGPLSRLQQDGVFWEMLGSNQLDAALARTSFFQLMHDDETRARLADLGLVPAAAREDPEAFRAAVRTSLTTAAPRIQAIRDDPALAQLAADPEVQSALQSGNGIALLGRPEFRELMDRALSD